MSYRGAFAPENYKKGMQTDFLDCLNFCEIALSLEGASIFSLVVLIF